MFRKFTCLSVTIQNNLFKMFKISIVNESSKVSSVRRRN